VFPVVETWQTQVGDLLIVGALRPISYDATALRQRIQEEPFRSALVNVWRVKDLEGFLAHFLSANSFSQEIARAPGVRLNTDDRTVMEFSFARAVALRAPFETRQWLESARTHQADRPQLLNGEIDWSSVENQRASLFALSGADPPIGLDSSPELVQRAQAKIKWLNNDAKGALEAWRSQSSPPDDLTETLILAELLAQSADEEALAYIAKLRPFQSVEADVILARLRRRQGRFEDAAVAFEAAFVRYRADPWPLPNWMRVALVSTQELAKKAKDPALSKRLYDALAEPFVVRLWEQERLACRLRIAVDLDQRLFHEALASFEPHVLWERALLEKRLECYRALGDPRAHQAERDLREFVREENRK